MRRYCRYLVHVNIRLELVGGESGNIFYKVIERNIGENPPSNQK